jgi:hypothetical protein
MTDLSPAARAVLYDAHNRWLDVDDDIPAQVAAAALRAAADAIEPVDITQDHEWLLEQLLAIAAELEGFND